MKIINLLGNEYSGTIGKSVTASKWKGRNYLKKWFKPTNPNTARQQTIRGYMAGAVAQWQGLTAIQKGAYYWYQRYRKTNISPFNALVGFYVSYYHSEGSPPGVPPPAGPRVEDQVPDPIVGALVIMRKTGQATDYYREYTIAGGLTTSSVPVADENYDVFITADGFQPYSSLDITAAAACGTHAMTPV